MSWAGTGDGGAPEHRSDNTGRWCCLISHGPRKHIQLYLLLSFSAKGTARLEIYWYVVALGMIYSLIISMRAENLMGAQLLWQRSNFY